MSIILSTCFRNLRSSICCGDSGVGYSHLRFISSWMSPCRGGEHHTLTSRECGIFQSPSWQYQQIRCVKRGTEYQPNNLKRKRTHGWIKRMRTQGGIEVILRRMLKGRKSLSH